MKRAFITKELGMIAVIVAVSIICAVIYTNVLEHGLRSPIQFHEDAMQHLMMAKSSTEGGLFYGTPQLNAPSGFTHLWYPIAGEGLLWLYFIVADWFSDDLFLNANLYFLGSFPLTSVITYGVFRLIGFGRITSAFGGILFAFLPQRWFRGQRHMALSSFWVVSLYFLAFIWNLQGKLVWKSWNPKRWTWRHWVFLASVPILAWSSTYITAIGLLSFSLLALILWHKRLYWQKLWSWGVNTVWILAAFTVLVGPIVAVQQFAQEPAPTTFAIGSRIDITRNYGLDLMGLVFPEHPHPISWLSDLGNRFLYSGIAGHIEYNWIGITASLGLLALIIMGAALLSSALQGSRLVPKRIASTSLAPIWILAPVSCLVFVITSIPTGIYEWITSFLPLLRVWNRSSFFISWMALVAIMLLLEWLFAHARATHRTWIKPVVILLLCSSALLGIHEQSYGFQYEVSQMDEDPYTPRKDIPIYRAFFEDVESYYEKPNETSILHLPDPGYPRKGGEHFWPYILTQELRWSSGGSVFTDSAWKQLLHEQAPLDMIVIAHTVGFDGITIDRSQLNASLIDELEAILGEPTSISTDIGQRFLFFDLTPHSTDIESAYENHAQHRLTRGFMSQPIYNFDAGLSQDAHVGVSFHGRSEGRIHIWNERPRPTEFTLKFLAVHDTLPSTLPATLFVRTEDDDASPISITDLGTDGAEVYVSYVFTPGNTDIIISAELAEYSREELHATPNLRDVILRHTDIEYNANQFIDKSPLISN